MIRIILLLLTLIPLTVFGKPINTEHEIFFKGSDYELHIYHIKGHKPGKTLLLIGGIQGDEPGGYLSADLYSDIELEKGNLIIVPRANLKSIILGQRAPDGDMNRQFHDEANPGPMKKVVEQLKKVMGEADLFLHLHDGWGFHRPIYIDELRNPSRYGQSLIVDTESFSCSDGEILELGKQGRDILSRVNTKISNKDHYLHFFDTKTSDTATKHKAMRKTATYYALRKHCLPAYGVEASKNLSSLKLKVLYHNLVINEFMADMGIIPITPRILVPKTQLHFAKVEINGKPQVIPEGKTLGVKKGDRIKITDITTNFPRGISCDLLGYGDLNDIGQSFTLNKDSKLIIRKEGKTIASIDILITEGDQTTSDPVLISKTKSKHRVFIVEVNGTNKALLNNETLVVNKLDVVKFIASFGDGSNSESPLINVKGWVPKSGGNNKGDDRNYNIVIGKDNFMKRYSRHGKGKTFPVIAEDTQGKKLGRVWVRIKKTDTTKLSAR